MNKSSAEYKMAAKEADEKYEKHGAFKSMYIVKRYKELGGKFDDDVNLEKPTRRWLEEKWVSVLHFLKPDGDMVMCGMEIGPHACRPLVKVNSRSPATIQELVDKHGHEEMLRLARVKRDYPDAYIDWENAEAILPEEEDRRINKYPKWVYMKDSERKNKRYLARFEVEAGKYKDVHFGARGGQTYTDHQDDKKKAGWIKRHSKMKMQDTIGEEMWKTNPMSPSTLSRYILWEMPDLDEAVDAYIKRFNL